MKKILIIDDDIDMCNLLSRFLQRKGFETDTAHNGNRGIAKCKENNFDVVLCDFRLGDKEGREVLRDIKAINPQTIVIIITGYSDIKIAVDVIKAGAFDYITKPLVPDEVLTVINKSLASFSNGVQQITKKFLRQGQKIKAIVRIVIFLLDNRPLQENYTDKLNWWRLQITAWFYMEKVVREKKSLQEQFTLPAHAVTNLLLLWTAAHYRKNSPEANFLAT